VDETLLFDAQWPDDLDPATVPFLTRSVTILRRAGFFDDWSLFDTVSEAEVLSRINAGVNTSEVGKRVGLASPTMSRYESAKRNPDSGIQRRLHGVYKAMEEQAIARAEWIVVIFGYTDAELNCDHDAQIERDDLMWWIATDTDEDTFTIEHLDGLSQFRRVVTDQRDDAVPAVERAGSGQSVPQRVR
jgi:transcriptional regulator with XRE-family HTH domain